jgi:type III restriction enzyme
MTNLFFEHPILNSPYAYPSRHWELPSSARNPPLAPSQNRT